MCRSRRELSNAYLLAKFRFDTAENEPSKVCPGDLLVLRGLVKAALGAVRESRGGTGPCYKLELAAKFASEKRKPLAGLQISA